MLARSSSILLLCSACRDGHCSPWRDRCCRRCTGRHKRKDLGKANKIPIAVLTGLKSEAGHCLGPGSSMAAASLSGHVLGLVAAHGHLDINMAWFWLWHKMMHCANQDLIDLITLESESTQFRLNLSERRTDHNINSGQYFQPPTGSRWPSALFGPELEPCLLTFASSAVQHLDTSCNKSFTRPK